MIEKIKSSFLELRIEFKGIVVICSLLIAFITIKTIGIFLIFNILPVKYRLIILKINNSLEKNTLFLILLMITIIIIAFLIPNKKMNIYNERTTSKPINDKLEIEKMDIQNTGELKYVDALREDDKNTKEIIDGEIVEKYENNRIIINSIISTKHKKYIVSKLRIKWKYIKGNCCSIDTCKKIEPILKWHVNIDIDTKNSEWKEKTIVLTDALELSPGASYVGVGNFNIELIYKLTNTDYHPNFDWNILYSIILIDTRNKEFTLIKNRTWRSIYMT